MGFEIGGILLIPLLIGVVEFAKSVGLTGEKSIRILTFVVGAILFALWKSFGLLPENVQTIASIVLWAIAGPLAAMGWYDLQKAMRPAAIKGFVKFQDLIEILKQGNGQ